MFIHIGWMSCLFAGIRFADMRNGNDMDNLVDALVIRSRTSPTPGAWLPLRGIDGSLRLWLPFAGAGSAARKATFEHPLAGAET